MYLLQSIQSLPSQLALVIHYRDHHLNCSLYLVQDFNLQFYFILQNLDHLKLLFQQCLQLHTNLVLVHRLSMVHTLLCYPNQTNLLPDPTFQTNQVPHHMSPHSPNFNLLHAYTNLHQKFTNHLMFIILEFLILHNHMNHCLPIFYHLTSSTKEVS